MQVWKFFLMLLIIIGLVIGCSTQKSQSVDPPSTNLDSYGLANITAGALQLPEMASTGLVLPEVAQATMLENLKTSYLRWRQGNHLDSVGNEVESPGYVQGFMLPDTQLLPWETEGSRAGAVIVMVPNGTPDELPGEYCVSTDEAMGYGMILSAQFGDWELFDRLLRVCLYYANYNPERQAASGNGWEKNLTTWAIPAEKGKDWFETDYFKGLSPDAQLAWREQGVQYDPKYLEGTTTPESVIVGVKNNTSNCGGSAMDGELDIAYALYLAAARHPDPERAKAYQAMGRARFQAIMALVDTYGRLSTQPELIYLPTGDYRVSYQDHGSRRLEALTRPCDWMNGQLRAYYLESGDERGLKIIESNYRYIDQLADKATGLIPDFAAFFYTSGEEQLMAANSDIANEWMSEYFYMNSARFPFRVAMDSFHYGDNRGKAAALKIVDFFIERHGFKDPSDFERYPAAIHSLKGEAHPEGLWQNAVLNAALYSAASMSGEQRYREFVTGGWQHLSQVFDSRRNDWDGNGLGYDPAHSGYFQDTWALLGMLTMSGHWTRPELPQQ